jgi:hypothetical protein
MSSNRPATRIVICQLCRKRVHRQRTGDWYHNHNASVSCRPGEGSGRRAVPFEVEVPAPDLGTHADLSDPVHHGDVFSRIEASEQ